MKISCSKCGEIHTGAPAFVAEYPWHYFDVPENEREKRCSVGSDDCVIDKQLFFVRGCLEIPVSGSGESLNWGVWVSLSESSFIEWIRVFDESKRSSIGPFFGWLSTELKMYPSTLNLKTMIHLRNDAIRPFIELEQTEHPLAVEQRHGITMKRLEEIYSTMTHLDDH